MKTIQLQIIDNQDHRETTLINSKGDKFTFNPLKHEGLDSFLSEDKLASDGVLADVSGMLPLMKEHQCFERGHSFYLVCEIDNGRSKYGDHKCSKCGHVESFQYDYGS